MRASHANVVVRKWEHGTEWIGTMHRWCPRDPLTKLPRIVPMIPAGHSTINQIVSCFHRYGCDMPVGDPDLLSVFKQYVTSVLDLHFVPVRDVDVPSLSEWLSTTPYSGTRRSQLQSLACNETTITERHLDNSSFLKYESYDKLKPPRAINSYRDTTKALVGPLVHAVDKATFKLPYFVKGSDPITWPTLLKTTFAQRPVTATDFSSFEAHHHGVLAECVRCWFAHMTRDVSDRLTVELVLRMMGQANKSNFGAIRTVVVERLMSGAMWTSSANGFLNLMIMSFLVLYTKYRDPLEASRAFREFSGFVEGDDGIFEGSGIDQTLIQGLGVNLELVQHQRVEDADFCSIYTDSALGVVVADPMKFLRTFYLLPPALMNARRTTQDAYMKAKALSYNYQYPGCPVIDVAVRTVLKRTNHIDHRKAEKFFDLFERHRLRAALKRGKTFVDITLGSRQLVCERFGLSVADQLVLERGIREGVFYVDHLLTGDQLYAADNFFSPLVQCPHVPNIVMECIRDAGCGEPLRPEKCCFNFLPKELPKNERQHQT